MKYLRTLGNTQNCVVFSHDRTEWLGFVLTVMNLRYICRL